MSSEEKVVALTPDFGCATMTEELDGAALVGLLAMDVGCSYTRVMHRCCLYPLDAGARHVLGALGWAEADEQERGRLALLWTERAMLVSGGIGGREVMREDNGDFERSGKTFSPPTAQPRQEGGFAVELWIRSTGAMASPLSYWRVRANFEADGTAGDDEWSDQLEPAPRPAPVTIEGVPPEGANPNRFVDAVRRRARTIDQCRRSEMVRVGGPIEGTIQLEITVDTEGTVSEVRVGDDGIGNADLLSCVTDKLRQLTWNPPPEAIQNRAFVIRFEPLPPDEVPSGPGPTVP